jgi:hypothetical protein
MYPLRTGPALLSVRKMVTPVALWLRRHVVDGVQDQVRGTHTADWVELAELGVAGEHRIRYVPSPWSTLRRVLPPSEVDDRDVFVDFGAGMGRMVLQAAEFPFSKVIGVELSEDLCRIARTNVDGARPRLRCPEVEIVHADVLDYTVPDDVTVAYFYNPFSGPIFTAVVQKLIDSVDRCPRRLRIVYHDPAEEDTLLVTCRIRLLRSTRGWRPTREWSKAHVVRLYEVTPR